MAPLVRSSGEARSPTRPAAPALAGTRARAGPRPLPGPWKGRHSNRRPRAPGLAPYGGPRPYTPLWRRLREDEWPPLGEVLRGRREQVRRPGVVLALFLPCLWPLTVPLLVGYQLARTARRIARRVFPVHPEGHVEDPVVLPVQRVQAWLALAISGLLVAVFGAWTLVPLLFLSFASGPVRSRSARSWAARCR